MKKKKNIGIMNSVRETIHVIAQSKLMEDTQAWDQLGVFMWRRKRILR